MELSPERRELLEAKGYDVVADDFLDLKGRTVFTNGDTFRAEDGIVGIMRGESGLGNTRVELRTEDGQHLGYYDRAELEPVQKNGTDSGYDRIIMNPPFSKRQDVEHVRHALSLLRPGGRLVAIMGEGAFFGQDKKASAFREWLEDVGGTVEKLPEKSFMDAALPVQTGVNARLVVIEKPKGEGLGSQIAPGAFLPPRGVGHSLRVQAVQRVVTALSGRAQKAAPTNVVDTFAALPADIRRQFAGQERQLEGLYDPGTASVYLVAENLTSTDRAAEVWMHENVVHHGLRGVFGVNGTTQLLNKLWIPLGGMGNPKIAKIASTYGLKPVQYMNDRQRVVEEYLANLAEKRATGKLTERDQTFWRRFVNAVVRAWNALINTVSGRTGSMPFNNMDRLLSVLDSYVFEGLPVQPAGRTSGNEALADVDTDVERFFYDEGILPSLRIDPPPAKTVKAYKLFRVRKDKPGKLFPLFVNADEAVDMGVWLDAEIGTSTADGKVKSTLGGLAMRPGWHAGDMPIATHIGEKRTKNDTAPSFRPENQVWAEIEAANDVDWQAEATRRAQKTKAGTLLSRTAHITDQIPKDGLYRYKTNPNMTGTWIISGSMKVNRVLPDTEVETINKGRGVADLPRLKPFDAEKYGFDALSGNTAGETPLASLRSEQESRTFAGIMENVKALFNLNTRDTLALADDAELKPLLDSQRLTRMQRMVMQPHWIAKREKEVS